MRKTRAILLVAALMTTLVAIPDAARATSVSDPCGDVTVVFARGSGESLNGDTETRFVDQIDERVVRGKIRVHRYELGAETYGGGRYDPAPAWRPASAIGSLLAADASWTGLLAGKYNAGLAGGVTEATTYVRERAARCPDEQFVLGGYSQGAQVIGDSLPGLDRSVRERIAYVGLFGDPKLHLPEGRGALPPACRGGELSPWRRGSVGCLTDGGILDARVPYVPDDMLTRVGSWCDRDDAVCTNDLADLADLGHVDYAEEGGGIDQAAREIAEALAARLPAHASDLVTGVPTAGSGTTGPDVAVIIDTTASMGNGIEAARESADTIANEIISLRGRVALVEYRDASDAFVAEVRAPLGDSVATFQNALRPLTAAGGGDTPDSLLTALTTALDGLAWRRGAARAAIVLTDAGYHDPDPTNGLTLPQVAKRCLQDDPVNVYAVVPGAEAGAYQQLTALTSGKVVPDTGDTRAALLAAITQLSTRPTALLALDEYFAAPSTGVVFDATPSHDPDSTITRYEWDFTGDGTFEETTTTPTMSHAYGTAFDGTAQVRVTSADGGVANATAAMHIDATGLAGSVPVAPRALTATVIGADATHRVVRLQWMPGSDGGQADAWHLYDGSGNLIALAGGKRTTLDVIGVPNEAVALSVAATNRYGTSDPVSVTVAAQADPSVPSAVDSSTSPASAGDATGEGHAGRNRSAGGWSLLGTTTVDTRAITALGVGLVLTGAVLLLVVRRRRRRPAP